MTTASVIVLVGPPCSGKSTYLTSLCYDIVISSDEIVELLCQEHHLAYHDYFLLPADHKIKQQHIERFNQCVAQSKKIVPSKKFITVVWDLTNLTRRSRKIIFKHYPKATFKAIVFEPKGHEALLRKRNVARCKLTGKYIDDSVLQKMLARYQQVSADEGFSQIDFIDIKTGYLRSKSIYSRH